VAKLRFLPRRTFAASAVPTFVRIADVNRDGKPDIVVASQGNNTAACCRDGAEAPVHFSVVAGAKSIAVAAGSIPTGMFSLPTSLFKPGRLQMPKRPSRQSLLLFDVHVFCVRRCADQLAVDRQLEAILGSEFPLNQPACSSAASLPEVWLILTKR